MSDIFLNMVIVIINSLWIKVLEEIVINFYVGRRYAKWHLWRDKLIYIALFFVIFVWFEWAIHSHVFPTDVSWGTWTKSNCIFFMSRVELRNLSHNLLILLFVEDVDQDLLFHQELLQSVIQGEIYFDFEIILYYIVYIKNFIFFRVATCCSSRGWCSSSPEDCLCDECLYYEWEDGQLLPVCYFHFNYFHFSSKITSGTTSTWRWQ